MTNEYMNLITFQNLPFGSIVYVETIFYQNNCRVSECNTGIVFGNKIGYSSGQVIEKDDISELMKTNLARVKLIRGGLGLD